MACAIASLALSTTYLLTPVGFCLFDSDVLLRLAIVGLFVLWLPALALLIASPFIEGVTPFATGTDVDNVWISAFVFICVDMMGVGVVVCRETGG
jgi:hypothetical protein